MSVEKSKGETQGKYPRFGQRHVQTLLLFFGMFFGYFLRSNISAAIVPMTSTPSSEAVAGASENANAPTYDWDSSTQSLILSSFFWGYVISQLPSGLLAKRFGAKIVLGLSTLIGSIITILHPIAIEIGGWKLLLVLRIMAGLTQGTLYPCFHTLLSKWVPRTERGFLMTIAYSGASMGTTVMMGISGKIFSTFGWPGIFYISGGLALAWSLIYFYFGGNEPAESKYISTIEREYIDSLTGSTETGVQKLPVPWRSILKSLPFYGLIAAQCGIAWGFYTLLTQIPTYLNAVLEFDVKSNALVSALPYLVMWILSVTLSPVADYLVNSRILNITVSRKLFNTLGEWVPMVSLIALGYMTKEQPNVAIILLTIAVGFNAFGCFGYLVNHNDLSPNFSGILMGIANALANICSVCAPLVVGVVVTNQKDPQQWRIVFFINAGIYLVCNGLFLLFGKATVQPWNEPTKLVRNSSLKTSSVKESVESVNASSSWTIESSIINEQKN